MTSQCDAKHISCWRRCKLGTSAGARHAVWAKRWSRRLPEARVATAANHLKIAGKRPVGGRQGASAEQVPHGGSEPEQKSTHAHVCLRPAPLLTLARIATAAPNVQAHDRRAHRLHALAVLAHVFTAAVAVVRAVLRAHALAHLLHWAVALRLRRTARLGQQAAGCMRGATSCQ